MNASWLQWLRGSVTIQIRGGNMEELVNRALADKLQLWSISRTSGGELLCQVTLRDFFRLKPLLKKTGCRLHILTRHGMPFWFEKLEKRLFFGVGLILFFIGMYVLSSLVWTVEVTGVESISEEQVLKAAHEEGLYPFQWSFRLADTDMLSKKLSQKIPGVAWVGVEKKGTKVSIKVVESTKPEDKPLLSPRHLVATTDAVVTDIMAETGRPLVKRNARVKKGDILISGILGDENNTMYVIAQGEVKGLVWHEYNIASPLERIEKGYTGEMTTRWYAVIGGRAVRVSGFGAINYDKYETERDMQLATWRTGTLPFGKMKEVIREVQEERISIEPKEAKIAGLEQARADVLAKNGPGAKIRAENILHEKTDNGKVYMKVLFEVEQSIATERPLVHTQGE
ncbi:sporulation protein YqfD [Paenibacillus sp. GCM10027626]|uniref:sporulation protein YqfD n=1 Tax=Paenibacillus sp. GCM10027626 TaxID=3273411 RepID=UPI00362E8CBD